ncbi:MAG: hypothetical protein IV112_04155 [Methyloversatilis discipulorum]|jgi:hypothetical protein|uniref:hypothetical protein n=1 Tax=Methyloversatilis discipulorum TaxID=1119528 RepID=UPI0026F1C462|nr:hypothetical protein [Methyloversatilis discipulorum]MBT9515862.1 hypothetical protein [Methyloversatilis discipulorum]
MLNDHGRAAELANLRDGHCLKPDRARLPRNPHYAVLPAAASNLRRLRWTTEFMDQLNRHFLCSHPGTMAGISSQLPETMPKALQDEDPIFIGSLQQ